MKEISKYLDFRYLVDILYLDFQKAFDKVPHCRLVSKLAAYGISGDVLRWIENWLSRRKQRVVLGGRASEWSDILSGVPQGSVLGPVLFVLYITDIDDTVNSKILTFADDTIIYSRVDSVEGIERMQADLRNLVVWSKE